MPKLVELEGGGTAEMFTKEELEAQIQAKAAEVEAQRLEDQKHYKTKIDEFAQAQKGFESKFEAAEKARIAEIEEAKRIAEEAKGQFSISEKNRLEAYQNFLLESRIGSDPALKAKFDEAASILNLPRTTEAEIAAFVEKAVQISGVENVARPAGGYMGGFGGGFAPKPAAASEQQSEADYNKFVEAINLKPFMEKHDPKKDME